QIVGTIGADYMTVTENQKIDRYFEDNRGKFGESCEIDGTYSITTMADVPLWIDDSTEWVQFLWLRIPWPGTNTAPTAR
ncbi:MAG: hypothetical protein KDE47_34535, partial [Caldilineaceae bacterium]|nr:hypothetical protein [Caldilineaceae bacterium]